jgi:hypothetical protein
MVLLMNLQGSCWIYGFGTDWANVGQIKGDIGFTGLAGTQGITGFTGSTGTQGDILIYR